MLSVAGFIAAALSPLAMTVGFIIWGKSWQATPYALNIFKCTLAGSLFLIISISMPSYQESSMKEKSMVILSSVIGIIIGDNTWLLALQIIGAKRVIVIDALKPFFAAFAGFFILNEPLSMAICIGLAVSSVGVVMVATEKESDPVSEGTTATEAKAPAVKPNYCWGYMLAAINVLLDAFGSVITKQFGASMSTWEINYLRFGFAAVFMALLSVFMYAADAAYGKYYPMTDSVGMVEMSESRHALSASFENSAGTEADPETTAVGIRDETLNQHGIEDPKDVHCTDVDDERTSKQRKWYEFPTYGAMTQQQWASVTVGVFFVTFLCPAMANYALFKLPLSLCLTLTSLGPVYALPLVYVLLGEKSGIQGIVGSLLAFAGIAIMCL